MESLDLLIHARWVIPVEPDCTPLEHHAVAVRDGRIVAVLPSAGARTRFTARENVTLPQHLLIPGLVDAHTHAAMTLLRGLADDLPLMDWLQRHIWPAESRWVGPEFVRDGSELAIAEMLRGGITCFQDMYFFPDVTAEVARRCGMRASLGMVVADFPSAWAGNAQDYLAKGTAVRDRYRNDPLLSFVFAPHAPYTVGDPGLRGVRTLADELDVPVQIHLHETVGEIEQSLAQYGKRPLARLYDLGLLTPNLMAVHMTRLEEVEIATLAETGVRVVHCPESNMKLASGFCPVAKLLDAGVTVALGTDGAASNNDLDLLGELRSASLLAKCVADDATALPADTALRMATLNGARALGLERDIGSLLPGKWADLTALDLSALECQPVHNPLSQLVYAAGRQHVSDVWVAGARLLRERELTRMDVGALADTAERWRARIGADENRESAA
ncbi:MAG TPA: TRZ/ATZ family hydrolase [Gammaproteobacteria bacterium]|nr:TRZ/ATZ family hydrolase [Gammaproteobacteria bacterium]